MRIKQAALYLLIILLCITCSKKQTITIISSPDQEFRRALDLLQEKKYVKAIETFQNIVFNYPGSNYAADAQFYLADAYFMKKDYQAAIPEYEFFINSFTGNQYLEEAYYKLALAYFNIAPSVGKDQAILTKTLDVLENLEERYPESKYGNEIIQLKKKIAERWTEKNFLIGELYFKGGEYGSARIYLDYVQNNFPESKWASHSRYLIGKIYEKMDSLPQAESLYQLILSDSVNIEIRKLTEQSLQDLKHR